MYTNRNVLALFGVVFFTIQGAAQINITADIFPTPGTTAEYYVMNNAARHHVVGSGTNQIWDLTGAQSDARSATAYINPSEGQHGNVFPNASLLVLEDLENETYYRVDNGGMRILGTVGQSFINPLEEEALRYSPPLYLCKTPLKLNDAYTQQSNIHINIPISLIPDTILSQLPIQPDSIRFRLSFTTDEACDGEGVLKLPGKDFEVLKLTSKTITVNYLEAKVPFLGWIDASSFVAFPGVGEEISSETVTFWSPEHIHYVALYTYDTDSSFIETAEITVNGTILNSRPALSVTESLTIYPNPVNNEMFIDNKSAKGQPYTMLVMDANGQIILMNKMQDLQSINTSLFQAGTYFVKVINGNGKGSVQKFIKL